MNNDETINDPARNLLIMVLGRYFKSEFGGTTDAAMILAEKIVNIMDEG